MPGLEQEIYEWESLAVGTPSALYERHSADPDFVPKLVALLTEVPGQRGSTWLLKHHLETSPDSIDPELAGQIYSNCSTLEHWEAKLHLLQCIALLPVPTEQAQAVAGFIRECVSSNKKFVKAWAYSAFSELAAQHLEYQDEANALLDFAFENETAASVRARIRNIRDSRC